MTEQAWSSTTTVDAIVQRLLASKSVVILTHSKPDGDAAGSAAAIARTLERVGAATQTWFVGPLPAWLPSIVPTDRMVEFAPSVPFTPRVAPGQQPGPGPAQLPDAVVIVDTGSWSQLAEVRPWLEPIIDRAIVIDHHLHGDPGTARDRLIVPKAAATTEALAPICCAMLGVTNASELPTDVATPLYLGIGTDTKWLRLPNVTPATLRLTAELAEAGVDHTGLYELIEQRDTPGRWKLLGRALSSLDLVGGGSIAVMTLSLQDFSDAGADQTDTGGFADMVLAIAGVRVSVVLSEAPSQGTLTKMSFRSKPGPGAVDVNALARRFGGGGHRLAAGAKIDQPVTEAKRILLQQLGSATGQA